MKILYAEDEQCLREIVTEFLVTDGYEVVAVDDGLKALNALSKSSAGEFKLLITDIMMPNMNGLELVQAVKHSNLDLPIIVCSATPSSDARVKEIKGHEINFVAKPFDLDTFLATVRSIYEKESSTSR